MWLNRKLQVWAAVASFPGPREGGKGSGFRCLHMHLISHNQNTYSLGRWCKWHPRSHMVWPVTSTCLLPRLSWARSCKMTVKWLQPAAHFSDILSKQTGASWSILTFQNRSVGDHTLAYICGLLFWLKCHYWSCIRERMITSSHRLSICSSVQI